jgi:hypothetical protein
MKHLPSTADSCRCARCGIWHDQDRGSPGNWLLVGPPGDPETFTVCRRCLSAIMRRRPQYLDPDMYLTLLPLRWPNRGRRKTNRRGSAQPMPSNHTVADTDSALRIAQATVPKGFTVGIGPSVEDGKFWIRIDDAPFPAFLPRRIIRWGSFLSYRVGPDTLTYPPRVAAVIESIREALTAAGIREADISLSQAAAERQAAQILALSQSAHGRMRLARLLGAAGLDEEAISAQLDWLDQTS